MSDLAYPNLRSHHATREAGSTPVQETAATSFTVTATSSARRSLVQPVLPAWRRAMAALDRDALLSLAHDCPAIVEYREGPRALTWAHRVCNDGIPGGAPLLALLGEAGVPLDAADRRGRRPLHLALASGQVASASVLLQAGADVNAQTGEWLPRTPLQVAAAHQTRHESVSLLLKFGADPRSGWESPAGSAALLAVNQDDAPTALLFVNAGIAPDEPAGLISMAQPKLVSMREQACRFDRLSVLRALHDYDTALHAREVITKSTRHRLRPT